MNPRAVLVLALVLAPALAISACDMDDGPAGFDPLGCTEIGCEDQLSIALERRDGKRFSPGAYDFVVTPSGADLSAISCALEGGADLRCGETEAPLLIEINEAGTEFEVRISLAPASINFSLAYEGKPLGGSDISPDYSVVTPNGPDCEPTCFQAAVSIAVASTD